MCHSQMIPTFKGYYRLPGYPLTCNLVFQLHKFTPCTPSTRSCPTISDQKTLTVQPWPHSVIFFSICFVTFLLFSFSATFLFFFSFSAIFLLFTVWKIQLTNTWHLPENRQALGTNILAAMLNTSNEVRQKLVNGPLVNNGTWHALSNFDLLTFTGSKERTLTWVETPPPNLV